ncbi:MAG: hypothetical protein IMZ53_15810, partial [Thermoplasmata archaeon]|nr:hypothetical protein [Thermoplasmata archaeon]
MNIFSEIDKFIRMLTQNPYISFIGFLIGIIGLLYALHIARRDKKNKWLRYYTGSSNLIENGNNLYPHLNVTYDGRKLDNFTITKLSIKNKGTEVIRPEDIAVNDPIRVRVNTEQNTELLEYAVIKVTDEINNFSLTKVDKNSFTISFGFIEPEDSITIQVLHTGKDSRALIVSGTVIGAKKPFATKDTSESIGLNSFFTRVYKAMFHFVLH